MGIEMESRLVNPVEHIQEVFLRGEWVIQTSVHVQIVCFQVSMEPQISVLILWYNLAPCGYWLNVHVNTALSLTNVFL